MDVPPHYRTEAVGEVWRVPYEERAREATAWAREQGLSTAEQDETRVCLLLIDVQNTFCTPGFELVVAGAVDDNRRLCEFLYRNLGAITQVVATLDTHQAFQVFHAAFLVDGDGRHPEPYTLVSVADVEAGRWRVSDEACATLGIDPEYARRHLERYTRTLEAGGKFALTAWPYHALLGGIGHALVSAVEEAIFFHSIARSSQPDFQVKGRHPLTEHYSALGPEVTTGPDGQTLVEKNRALVEQLRSFEAVVVAGQAKSHCVAWTVEDLVRAAPDIADRLYLLEDCTSPVVVPGVVDFTVDADDAFARFAEAGAHVVQSTDPVEGWPGRVGAAPAR